MDTEIEFLRRFESELSARAKADARREASPPKARYPRRWKPWVAAASLLLVVATGIGLLASSGMSGSQSSMAAGGAEVRAPNQQALPGTSPTFGKATGGRAVHGPFLGSTTDASTGEGDLQQQAGSASSSNASNGGGADLSKIIRDGQIAVTIDDGTFKATAGSVAHIAAVNGGSILSSSTEGGDSGSFTVRVP